MMTAILVLTIILQLILALFVYLKGKNSLTNRLFTLICLATLGWSISNYISISFLHYSYLIYVVRFILFCVVLQNTFFYTFAKVFPNPTWRHSKRKLALYSVFSLLAAIATLSPYVFTAVIIKDGLPATQAGPAIVIFIAHSIFSITLAFGAFFKKLHKASGVAKNQLNLLLLASFLVWILVPITNFVITPLLKTTTFIVFSPIYTLAFTGIIGYAIVSQKLFDIRLLAARALAYILSLTTIIGAYALVVFGVTDSFFRSASTTTEQRAFYIGFAILSSLFYQYIKKFFDKLTNRIFFRDAYEPQVFLDELNSVLVANTEIDELLTSVIAVVMENLKASFIVFSIHQTSFSPRRTVGDNNRRFSDKSIETIINSIPSTINQKVITIDRLGERDNLKIVLEKSNIAIIVSLLSTQELKTEVIGHILFGAQKSGNLYSKTDLRMLEIIANELVIAIQNGLRFEEIEKFNATLQRKIDEATTTLQKTNDKLKALDATKDEFISMASHQLRTPLTSVKGYLSMVLEGDAGTLNEMQNKLLAQAFVSSQRMVYLIADLLNVSRLRTGKFVLDTVPTNLAEVVDGEVSQLKDTAGARGLSLTYQKPSVLPTLQLDETKIRQVVMNFMDNAIHYTPNGGHITVKVAETAKSIEYTVRDDGIGVSKAEQHHLFTKFYRAKNAKKARPDGTGLGLFMAKKVVIAHGGAILFSSSEGKGSTFGFSLPKKTT